MIEIANFKSDYSFIEKAVSSFFCKKNPDIAEFLKNKAMQFERRSKARTYLITDKDKLIKDNKIDIVAYFSIALKNFYLPENLSKTKKRKIDGFNKESTEVVTYLIGQLGRNDKYFGDIITGKEILDYAIDRIIDCQSIVGGRVILVECKDIEGVLNFYKSNEFELIEMDEENETFVDDIINLLPTEVNESIISSIREVAAQQESDPGKNVYKKFIRFIY